MTRKNDLSKGRYDREWRTVQAMIGIYCRGHHKSKTKICPDCEDLSRYARLRLEYCPHGDQKPTCSKCTVHCYRKDRKEEIKKVMRYAGPRMLFKHPFLALYHLWIEKVRF